MIDDYLTEGAYRVTSGPVTFYNAVPASSPLTLTGTAPTISFRCAVTVSVATGHVDVAGTVVVGAETLTFTQASRKTTTVALTSLPAVTYANLDCNIKIEAIDLGGMPLDVETLTAIDTRIEPHQSMLMNPNGAWEAIRDTQIFSDTDLDIGDVVRKGSRDYIIKQIDENPDLGGDIAFYTYLA